MRSFVIGLVLLFAVFTFVGAMGSSKDAAKASVQVQPPN